MRPTLRELLARNAEHAREFQSRFDGVQDGQRPAAVTVCCSDSRVLGDHLWRNDEPGELFACQNVGNRVLQRTRAGDVVSGDVLYPLVHAGTDAVVVVGHTGCGAVTATYDHLRDGSAEPPGIEHCVELLRPHLEPGVEALPSGLDRAAAVNRLVEYNVDRQVEALVGSEDVPDATAVLGVVYDFQDVYSGRRGEVHVVAVDGERDVEALREAHPEVADRIRRLWSY
jgi:carbonic anhydrase